MPPSRLRQLLKFMRVFGPAAGLRLWWTISQRPDATTGLRQLPVPGLPAPLQVRERDLPIFWQIWVMRENEFAALPQAKGVTQAYQEILDAGQTPVIVDCGGHIGLSAVWFASQFPKATVYSVEPSDANFAMLQTNAGAYKNIVPLKGGIWSQSCHLEILNPNSGSASFRLREVHGEEGAERPDLLRAYTVDEIVALESRNQLLLVKIDVEGAEAEVFRDPGPWLAAVPAIVIELHDWLLPGQGTSTNFFRRIAEHPFDVVLQGENLLVFRTAASAAAKIASRLEEVPSTAALVS